MFKGKFESYEEDKMRRLGPDAVEPRRIKYRRLRGDSDSMTNWSLYWVESDGVEDCFVVARNRQSAERVERDMNGFERGEVSAIRLCKIPAEALSLILRAGGVEDTPRGYAGGRDFFSAVGAEFRFVAGNEQIRLSDFVFDTSNGYDSLDVKKLYTLDKESLDCLWHDPELRDVVDEIEDAWLRCDKHLLQMLGFALLRCQEIEFLASQCFILCLSEKEKRKYKTIADLQRAWRSYGFGRVIRVIRDGWDLHPLLDAAFDLFLDTRNLIIHRLLDDERFSLGNEWGQREVGHLMPFFMIQSQVVLRAFEGAAAASISYAKKNWQADVPPELMEQEHEGKLASFWYMFSLKGEKNPQWEQDL